MRIKVKYRREWYYAKDISIDVKGNLFFEYLHGLNGCADSDHIGEYKIITDNKESWEMEVKEQFPNMYALEEKKAFEWCMNNREEAIRLGMLVKETSEIAPKEKSK